MENKKVRVGINGLGRIGKAIVRNNLNSDLVEIVHINDVNPDISNIAYQLNYDTLYGNLKDQDKFIVKGDRLENAKGSIMYSINDNIANVDWDKHEIDIVIDSSGIKRNVLDAHKLVKGSNIRNVVVTHSPDEVDFTLILGVNDHVVDPMEHKVISSSICDATALAPVLFNIARTFGISSGYVTTLHPWLNYQKLMDGASSSWSVPGDIYHHYALGRSSIGNMIPKPTSAMDATFKVLPKLNGRIGSFSYRTPTNIVGSADLTLVLENTTDKETIISLFKELETNQKWEIFSNTQQPLVSLDFQQTTCSVNIDHRWTDVQDGNLLKLVLWYDNEWGYASKVLDQVVHISKQWK